MHSRADIAFALALGKFNQSTITASSPLAKDSKGGAGPSGESNVGVQLVSSPLTLSAQVQTVPVPPLKDVKDGKPFLDIKDAKYDSKPGVSSLLNDIKTNTLAIPSAPHLAPEVKSSNIVLVFAHCSAGQFGDYVQSGEIAYALGKHCKSTGSSQQFVLVSSKDGIEKFKQLYLKNSNDQALTIHGMSFGFTALEDFVLSGQSAQVSHFVKVTGCGDFDFDLVRQATNSKTKYFYLAPPWNDSTYASSFQNGFLKELREGRVGSIYMGVGRGRLGFTVYDGPIEQLNHHAYFNVTKKPFAFAYFKNRGGCRNHKASFAGDFMQIAYQSTYKASNYVFIGDEYDIEIGIKRLVAIANNLKVVMYAPQDPTSKLYSMKAGAVQVELEQAGVPHDEKNTVNVVALDRVPNEQMRSLMHTSIPFMGVAGVMSMLEAFALGKIPMAVHLRNNQDFFDQHDEFLSSSVSSGPSSVPGSAASVPSGSSSSAAAASSVVVATSGSSNSSLQARMLAKSLLWNQCQGFSVDTIPHVVALLNDEKVAVALQNANRRFAGTNATKGIFDALGVSSTTGIAATVEASDDKHYYSGLMSPSAIVAAPALTSTVLQFDDITMMLLFGMYRQALVSRMGAGSSSAANTNNSPRPF